MAQTRRRWLGRLFALFLVAGLAAGVWYANTQGWLAPVQNWLSRSQTDAGRGKASPGGHAGHGAGGMNMPGMDAGSAGQEPMGTPSSVPGHATAMIPGELQQRIGVRIGRVERGPLKMSVNALGIVQPDETRVARINIKTEGWVDKLFVNFVGQTVRKGDPLLSIYSPQFLSTQQELLNSLRAERTTGGEKGDRSNLPERPEGGFAQIGPVPFFPGGGQQPLSEAARRRLELWDVPPDEIDQIVRTSQPHKDLILRSPINGTVLERNVFERQYVTPEKELYVIGDLSTVWVQAKVYEYEIPHVELGQPATVTISSLPDRQFTGKVVFVQPTVEEVTRTVQVRVELPNQQGIFKPGMFAQISIRHPMGEGLLVPTSAVLRTGERDIAYRVEPGDHFVPVEVKISPIQFGDRFQVLEGLKEAEQVVISANFLIDSESRIRLGGGGMAGMHHGGKETPAKDHSGHEGMEMPGMDHSKMQH